MNLYTGKFTNENWYEVFKNGEPFDHKPSLKVRNHSPDGFSWGYYGSGCAQLSLALLMEECGETAPILYQKFKEDVIARLPNEEGDEWQLTGEQIKNWYEKNKQSDMF